MSEEQIEALRVFAGYVGLAIENARLYAAVQRELIERKRAEAEREALIAELETKNAELERTVEILKAATSFFVRASDPQHR